MPIIPVDDWRPRGIIDLEPAAWAALRCEGSVSVSAGPGSGKSELLAQRAVYLLETGVCPWPRRILAISFKKDAAVNLAHRVRQRCQPDLSCRFTSLTFDAFTKGLVDRFLNALPDPYRPSRPYNIGFLERDEVVALLSGARLIAPDELKRGIAGIHAPNFEANVVGLHRLPLDQAGATTAESFAVRHYWSKQIRHGHTSALTFVGLNRLAELLVRSHNHIACALRSTYPFVFVDEFQDTSYAQYDFLKSVFSEGGATVTAVGDDKQRIMAWAGARPDAFERFGQDFEAPSFQLLFNFRSSTGLVRIQHFVARALNTGVAEAQSQAGDEIDGDVAQVWVSQSKTGEATRLADWLVADMAERASSPRDYALIVRQKADRVEAEFSEHLKGVGLKIRNESVALGKITLQDLLADDLARVALALLRLGATPQAPQAWAVVAPAVETLRVVDPEDERACSTAAADLETFIERLRQQMATSPLTRESAIELGKSVFEFLDPEAIGRSYPAYRTEASLRVLFKGFVLHLISCTAANTTWPECLDDFEGVDHISLMTVHKSKGLEFDTIIFLGLDDTAWWSYSPADPEGIATFFVALSRAKQRAIFSFCRERGTRTKIADLYALLKAAGVPEIAI